MKRNLCLAASISLTAGMALASGQVTLTGVGRVSNAPDYIELGITVTSECYGTPSLARVETDKRVAKIVDILKSKIDQTPGTRDAVLASGGYSAPFTRTYYTVDGARQTSCEGTYQKSTVITLKTSKLDTFSEDFDAIQEKVLAEFKTEATGDNHDRPVTFVSIGSPQPQLFHETAKAATEGALALAIEDAKLKLEATFSDCTIHNYNIASYTDSADAPREMPYMKESAARMSDGDSVAPVAFDDIWTKQSLKVVFNFEGGQCSKRAKHH